MKLTIFNTAALLTISGALMFQSAKAQFTGQSGDLILGFSDTSGSGASTNYEIDLGQFTSYTGDTQIPIVNISSDLASVYGSGWATDPNLTYSIAGVVNNGAIGSVKNNSVFISDPGTAFPSQPGSSLGTPLSEIGLLYTPGLQTGSTAPVAGTAPNSYDVNTGSGYSLAAVSSQDGFTGTSALIGGKLYLDTLQPGSSPSKAGTSILGADPFTVTSGGEVIYDLQAVPEPSTYVLGGVGLLLLVVLKRRQLAPVL